MRYYYIMLDNKKIIEILSDLNLNQTAETFKKEIGSMTLNNEHKKDLLKQIINHLNSISSNESDVKIKSENDKSQKQKQEIKQLFNSIINKVSKRLPFEIDSQVKSSIEKTTIFSSLMKKIEKKSVFTLENTEHTNGYLQVDKGDEEDLPHFGTSQHFGSSPHNKNSNEGYLLDSKLSKQYSQQEESMFPEGDEVENKLKTSSKFDTDQQFDYIIKNSKLISELDHQNYDINNESSFFQNSKNKIVEGNEDSNDEILSISDEYVDDDDPGFDLYECEIEYFRDTCKKLSEQYGFPKRAIKRKIKAEKENNTKEEEKIKESKSKEDSCVKKTEKSQEMIRSIKIKDIELSNTQVNNGEKLYEVEQIKVRKSLLDSEAKFMPSSDPYYPLLYNNTIYDCFNIRTIVDRERTGFEESKEFRIVINSLIAGRYHVMEYLGSAVFSKAVKVFCF